MGPKVKKSRALGVALTPKAARIMKKRPSPPGQHGDRPRRMRPSNFAVQLMEKQRLRFQYNVSERYLQRMFALAMFTALRANGPVAPYMTSEDGGFAFRFGYLPERDEIPVICDAHLIVEFYSR